MQNKRRKESYWATYVLHIDLALVHELNEALDLGKCHILHYDNRITFAGIVREHRIKEGAAGAQDHAMGPYQLTLARQGHVTEAASVQQLREHRLQITVMVLPAQAILLR